MKLCSAILNDVEREGYCIGWPDSMNGRHLDQLLCNEVLQVMTLVYTADVINRGFGKSNLRKNGEGIHVVITEWDCPHCIIEVKHYRKVKDPLVDHNSTLVAQFV